MKLAEALLGDRMIISIEVSYRINWRVRQYARIKRYAQIRHWGKEGPRPPGKGSVSKKVAKGKYSLIYNRLTDIPLVVPVLAATSMPNIIVIPLTKRPYSRTYFGLTEGHRAEFPASAAAWARSLGGTVAQVVRQHRVI